ncbi:MAG: VWA domain-containing protein, partial [Bdellovibrionaceae bacterium]|nr:VWA domain-containing protein [Pseudobdellovibrionaceae bacterium]
MKKYIISFIFILVGCSNVEFSQTDESLRKELNKNEIQINYGALYTQDITVHLDIIGKKDQEMYVTNDSTCQSGGEWEEYTPEKQWDLSHLNQTAKVYVKFKDVSKVESDCLSDDIIHDNIPPVLSFKNAPKHLNNNTRLNINLVAEDKVSGVKESFCALEGNIEFVKCKDQLKLQSITEGHHKLSFTAVDNAGNRSEVIDLKWQTDLTPPRAHFHKVPPKLSNLSEHSLQYYAEDELGISGFHCSYNRKAFTSCKTETFLKQVKNGKHSFYVMAVDNAGNQSEPINYNWVVDTEAPSIRITKHPDAYTRDTRGEFQFVATDDGIELNDYECQINKENWESCKNKYITPNLVKGSHTFRVRAIDLAGNYSSPSSYSWLIDLTAPDIKIVSAPPKLSNKEVAEFILQASDLESGVKKYWCWLDFKLVDCSTHNKWNQLLEGNHQFEALAEDNVGNFSDRVRYDWKVDLKPPQLKFNKVPDLYIAGSTTIFGFEATDDNSQIKDFSCKLVNGVYASCTSPLEVNNLKEGKQIFYVKAKDEAGNESDPISHSWFVDQTPPSINFAQKPANSHSLVNSVFKLNIEDNLSGFDKAWCGLSGQLTECAADEVKTYNLTPGEYEFQVVAFDKVGNRSSTSYKWEMLDKLKPVNQNFSIDKNSTDVDILFVIDNSNSMAEEQKNMAQRIDNFISKIADINWNIAVTSTDPDTTGFDPSCSIGSTNCNRINIEHGDGGLVKFSNGSYVLSSNTQSSSTQTLLGNAIQLGIRGSHLEQGIRATYRVLEKSLDKKFPYHQSFIRSQAALAVVLITDEDESDKQYRNYPENLLSF